MHSIFTVAKNIFDNITYWNLRFGIQINDDFEPLSVPFQAVIIFGFQRDLYSNSFKLTVAMYYRKIASGVCGILI